MSRRRSRRPEHDERVVTGLQPVREAIRAHPEAIRRLLVDRKSSARLAALVRFAEDNGVDVIQRLPRSSLDGLAAGAPHQGAVAMAAPLDLSDFGALLAPRPTPLLAVALDGVQDPQNFGAVVRSSVALGADAVVWGEHASAPLSAATFRASAGGVEHATLCRVPALAGALRAARDAGAAVVGLDIGAPLRLDQVDLSRPAVLVVGGEHAGLARSVRAACTSLARIAARRGFGSLNASVAAAVALYEAGQQRSNSRC